ncbi:MAG: (d)CMP kinase [Ignavibacteriota bacterium]|mgnify:CR=1 FL=1|jgi:cytidylate kinase|nr:MAG: (d)CMP kinase [Chlorobiota bacterium]MBE7477452.1 (d)CMP kinase [Ignavibacteriales bacterium]MBL1122855.1 (d)CMP kinase [Ignavibacteriota bacterium]MBV6421495.1 Cytidylate kinase [Ignavibacteriaceae bacterium]MCE7856471.1 (d)CMP kinase [Ignavibacteria bacterium CHB3]MEB2296546.1 (d)CMP kinase [Ignavibacteria bacterium]
MSKGLVVAIDGPAGSGKSTSAKLIAQKLGYIYIDTGAMYRAITYLALQNGAIGDEIRIIELARRCKIDLKFEDGEVIVLLNDKNVSKDIRSTEVNEHVSEVSRISEVRKLLVEKQRDMGEREKGIVMEGRDIGTVVFPNADVKIFLTASLDIRADRRAREYLEKGSRVLVNDIRENLSNRDKIDSSRNDSPLTKAADAIEVDTTNVSIDQQVNLILEEVQKAATKKNIQLKINKPAN